MQTDRRTLLRVAATAAGGGGAVGAALGSRRPQSGDHPRTEHIDYGWSPPQPLRWIPASPSVAIHAEAAGGWWEVCIEHSDVYAQHVVDTHPMWTAFNDVDAVEGNIRWHYLTRFEPDDDTATIELWERHNPLNPFDNVFDAEAQVEDHPDYDSIDGGGASIRDAWEDTFDVGVFDT